MKIESEMDIMRILCKECAIEYNTINKKICSFIHSNKELKRTKWKRSSSSLNNIFSGRSTILSVIRKKKP